MAKLMDLMGEKFGKLLVIGRVKNSKQRNARWKCLCECGNVSYPTGSSLVRKRGPVKSCGCIRFADLKGKKFGRLTPIERIVNKQNHTNKQTKWLCKCDCGKIVKVQIGNLVNGSSASCGCYRKEIISKMATMHCGSLSSNWNPKLTNKDRVRRRNINENKVWRKRVFEEDDYTCQECGDNSSGNLNAHHIKSYKDYKKLRHDVTNGITMCYDCHKRLHQRLHMECVA